MAVATPQWRVVINVDFSRLPLPTPRFAAIFEVSDTFLLLAVERHQRLTWAQKLLDLFVHVTALLIPSRRRRLVSGLDVGRQGIPPPPQPWPHRFVAHRVALPCQFFRHPRRRLIPPPRQAHRIARRILPQDAFPDSSNPGWDASHLFGPPPGRRMRSPVVRGSLSRNAPLPFRMAGRDRPLISCIAFSPPGPRASTSRATYQRACDSLRDPSTFNSSSSAVGSVTPQRYSTTLKQ